MRGPGLKISSLAKLVFIDWVLLDVRGLFMVPAGWTEINGLLLSGGETDSSVIVAAFTTGEDDVK